MVAVIAGSPYQYTVGKVPSGGTHKVEFGGPGVEKGEVGAKSTFSYHFISYVLKFCTFCSKIRENLKRFVLRARWQNGRAVPLSEIIRLDLSTDWKTILTVKLTDNTLPDVPCFLRIESGTSTALLYGPIPLKGHIMQRCSPSIRLSVRLSISFGPIR